MSNNNKKHWKPLVQNGNLLLIIKINVQPIYDTVVVGITVVIK